MLLQKIQLNFFPGLFNPDTDVIAVNLHPKRTNKMDQLFDGQFVGRIKIGGKKDRFEIGYPRELTVGGDCTNREI